MRRHFLLAGVLVAAGAGLLELSRSASPPSTTDPIRAPDESLDPSATLLIGAPVDEVASTDEGVALDSHGAGDTLHVRVRTPGGRPLPDELLVLQFLPARPGECDREAHSDRHGRVSLTRSGSGRFRVVHRQLQRDVPVWEGERAPTTIVEVVAAAPKWSEFELRVFSHAGARVTYYRRIVHSELWRKIERGGAFFCSDRVVNATLGSDRLRVRGPLPVLVWVLPVELFGQAPHPAREARVAHVPDSGVVEVRLPDPDVLTGSVRHADGRPMPEVSLRVTSITAQGRETLATMHAAADGTLHVRLPDRTLHSILELCVDVPRGYLPIRPLNLNHLAPKHDVVVQPGGSIEGQVSLPPGVRVSGTNLISVRWRSVSSDAAHVRTRADAKIDEHGRFIAYGVALDRPLSIEFNREVLRAANLQQHAAIPDLRAGMTDVMVTLQKGLVSVGTLSFEDGAPDEFTLAVNPLGPGSGWSVPVDRDGSFVSEGMAPGPHLIYVQFGARQFPASTVFEAGHPVALRVGSLGSIRVRIPGATEGFIVSVWDALRLNQVSYAGVPMGGEAVLGGLPLGRSYFVVARSSEAGLASTGAVEVGDDVTLSPSKEMVLGGTMIRGKQVLGGTLVARSTDACFGLHVDAKGAFHSRVLPGRYDLIFVSRSGEHQVLARDVAAGRTDLALSLR